MPDQPTNGSRAPGAKKKRKPALGRGLDALIPDLSVVEGVAGSSAEARKDYFLCEIDMIRPNRYQPRRQFPADELAELAESIRTQGIIQPLLVRPDDVGYELVTGERRLRAAAQAGIDRVPVVVKEVTDAEMLEMSIVENIQRENLNPMEEAEAYQRLITEFSLTQEAVAGRVGKSRSAVANFLRLRQLPDPIKARILDGALSMGHARALLGAETPAKQQLAFRDVVAKKLSVRETENLIKRLNAEKKKDAAPEPTPEQRYFNDLSEDLSRHFGTHVRIQRKGKKGRLEIDFFSDEDLDRLLTMLRNR
ncbi:Stage 0 sporulation protein J [Desulfosarcina cetonica]|uniref:ParB/RepB/Spo0J family partition protein n=1 Tax=Desulfosarcina cetonica TaxID=90730 RepID=UPI0006CFE0BD|nr:ParB/RepB/Spo0J family partition protein [Desulfosarcina cetonica]VTR67791.1 Stage 0 sporulation protein J [Desulfosarcina cetonica]